MHLIRRESIRFVSFAFLAFSANFVFAESRHVSALDLSAVTIVDMTYPYNDETIYWPTSPSSFELTELEHGHTDGGYFYASNRFCSPEHGGTHFDAPIHFSKEGRTSDQIPIQQFLGPLVVIDIREKAAANVIGLENVANIDRLPPLGAWIIALPMKISNGTGGPIRIVGLIPKQVTE